ncbi:MAG: alkyl hydroperoxide reductase/Thiol specific antioxidant/Mal allergen, partial [Rickettsiaceae bacterium]|nr:alkyl hydroperoxide reductase/Thiol specific antioxidant/Mal allergen [Rickettsiaceae bacterium]
MAVLVGKQAPDFTAKAVMPNNEINDAFNLKSYLKGKVGVLFFYPLDFTFVCPSEIIAFNNKLNEFKTRGAEVISVS